MKLEIKTTTQITQEHRKFIKEIDNLKMKIYLEKSNKKWVSVESLLQHKILWKSDSKDNPLEYVILIHGKEAKELEEKQ